MASSLAQIQSLPAEHLSSGYDSSHRVLVERNDRKRGDTGRPISQLRGVSGLLPPAFATDGALDPLEPHHNPSPHFRPKLPFDSTVTAHDTGDMPPNVPFQRRLPRHQTEAQTPVTTTTR